MKTWDLSWSLLTLLSHGEICKVLRKPFSLQIKCSDVSGFCEHNWICCCSQETGSANIYELMLQVYKYSSTIIGLCHGLGSHWPLTVEAWVSIPLSVHVRFEVDTVAMGQVFLQVFKSSPVSIMLWKLHTHI